MADGSGVIDFLQQLRPGGPWVLLAFPPDTGPNKVVTAKTPAEVAAFVGQYNGHRNLYYSANPTRTPIGKKPTKQDIAALEFIYGDLDPNADETPPEAKARYLAALASFHPAPTAVVDSGNGLQVLWRLNPPIPLDSAIDPNVDPVVKDFEARAKALMLKLGSAAGTQNIDRILRLPDTVNLPNETKRKKGRVRCDTSQLQFDGQSAPLSAFPKEEQPHKAKPQSGQQQPPKALPQALIDMLSLTGTQPGGRNSRSELFWAFINKAMNAGIDENAIVTACLDAAYAGNSIYEHVRSNDGESYVKKQIAKAANANLTDDRKRVIIDVVAGKLDDTWRRTEQALIAAGCPVYVRGGRLVQPLWRWEKADDHSVLTAGFEAYNVPRLSDVTAHHAVQFRKFDKREKRQVNIDPPYTVMERLIEIKHWSFPTVVGIINSPTLRSDGSLLSEPGYDTATQLWYKSSGDVELPPILERPTRQDAETALKLLNGLLGGFPFEQPQDKSAELAGMMTPPLRGALQSMVPLFMITANEPRSGKTYLVHLNAVLATGHFPVPTAGSERPEEMEKRIETAALSGRAIMHLNNLPNGMVVESNALTQFASEGHIRIRMLGRHEEGLCDCKGTTVFMNGNNIAVSADLVVRTVVCRLNAEMERPEERTFEFDPIAQVRADRGSYLAAIFTIARAFRAAGCPKQNHKVVAGLETWSRWVQQPLIWLGMEDPLARMEDMRALDPYLDELQNLITTLRQHFPANQPFTVADCRKLAEETEPTSMGGSRYSNTDLRNLMMVRGQVNERSFGKKIMYHFNRIVDGWSIALAPGGTRVRTYMLRPHGPIAKGPEEEEKGPNAKGPEEEPF